MPTLDEQVDFISGITSGGLVAAQTAHTWNGQHPAGYEATSNAAKWGSTTAGTGSGTINYDFDDASAWSVTEQDSFRSILAFFSAVANVSFTEAASLPPDTGITIKRGASGSGAFATTLRVGTAGGGNGAIGGTKLWTIPGSTVNIETGEPSFAIDGTFTKAGGHPWTTAFHEIGHALGLGHAGPYPASGTTPENAQYSAYDSEVHTVMSYIHPSDTAAYSGSYPVAANWGVVSNPNPDGSGTVNWRRNPVTLMPLDILAMQRLYGTPTSTPLSGGQIYGFNTNIGGLLQKFFDFTINTAPVVTLWNAGGNNTLDLSGYSAASTVNLTAGSYSSVAGLTNNIAIAYNTAINTAIGGSGNDTINANNDGNTLRGGTGNDALTGGNGSDTLWGDAGTNTLNGGNGSDTARYALARASYVVTRNVNNNTLTVTGTGISDTLSGIETLAFLDQTIAASSIGEKRPRSDFDGDGKSDVVLQHTSGLTEIWLLNGSSVKGSYRVDPGSSNWRIAGTSDFDNDGKGDLALQHTTGLTEIWLLSGSSVRSSYRVNPGSSSWRLAGTDDFDGDGDGDMVFQHDNGLAQIWYMSGSSLTSSQNLAPGTGWKVMAVGDFDGDGRSDVLMQNINGQAAMWLAGTSALANAGPVMAGGWNVKTAGDFNGDGRTDLVVQQGSGMAELWMMNGTTRSSSSSFNPGSAWKIKNTGDYDGDRKDDLVLQHDTGLTQVWLMDGSTVKSTFNVDPGNNSWGIAGNLAPQFFYQAKSDFSGDSRSDLLLANGNGQLDIWILSGASRSLNYGLDTGSNRWQVAAGSDFDGDGKSDVALRHDTGLTEIWLLNGSSVKGSYRVDPGSSSWRIVGANDFNGDGKGDLVLQHDNGLTQIWLMNGSSVSSFYNVNPGSNDWRMVGTGDVDADGKSDLVLRHENGTIQIWVMNGSSLRETRNLSPGSTWQVRGTGDFDGDRKSDVLVQNTSTGQAAIWFAGTLSQTNAGSPLAAGWRIANTGDFDGDGKSDIVLQHTGGQTQVWVMNGATRQSSYDITPAPSASWLVAAT